MDTTSPLLALEGENARTIGRKSARGHRVDILTGVERRRSWTVEQKRSIVGESLGPQLTPTEVARKYGISTGQLYTWRQHLTRFQGTMVSRAVPRFAPVDLTASVAVADATPEDRPTLGAPPSPPPPHSAGLIEILLPGGVSLRVDTAVDVAALRRVLDALAVR